MSVNYQQVYCKGLDIPASFVCCEITGSYEVDISHNIPRGMGGAGADSNKISNLMALTRPLHNFLENNPSYYWWFNLVHMHYLYHKVPYIEFYPQDPILEEIKNNLNE